MKRTLLLVIISLVLLAACGNGNSNKMINQLISNKIHNQIQIMLKQSLPIKMFKAIITEQSYHLKKVKHVVSYKIIWQIAIMGRL